MDGNPCASWRLAAEARGLVASDGEYDACLLDAAATSMPRLLRDLFVSLLVHCDVANALALWRKHAADLSQDQPCPPGVGNTHEVREALALTDIQSALWQHGKRLKDFDLPEPKEYDAAAFLQREVRQAYAFDRDAERSRAAGRIEMLNPAQRRAFDAIVAALDAADPTSQRCFYVDGPGGAGKTFLYETLIRFVHGRGEIALACAWSGVAATLLPGGITAHGLFGFPFDMPPDNAVSHIKAQTGRADVLRLATVIVWDEASMVMSTRPMAANKITCFRIYLWFPTWGKLLRPGLGN